MGKSFMDGEDLVLTEIPVYASNIVASKGNGLAGEIIVSKDCLSFFETTGEETVIQNKKCLVINSSNRYMFDKSNLLEYMAIVKNEYISVALFRYKEFKAEPWKNVNYLGWERRVTRIKAGKASKKFKLYIKKTNDTDPTKGTRYYMAGLNSDEYSFVVKYCIIPQYTNIRIKKRGNSKGGYDYTFLLEVKGIDNIQRVIEDRQLEDESKYSSQPKDVLYKSARKKSDVDTGGQEGQTVTTTVYKRDPEVSAYVKMRAEGKCDMCLSDAPFNDKKGNPYLEEHHVVRLADGGEDSIDNAVALCPNCHRMIHVIGTKEMSEQLIKRIKAYAKAEEKYLSKGE